MGLIVDVWRSVSDDRRCPACGAINGHVFRAGSGPVPPLHTHCRCVRQRLAEQEITPDLLHELVQGQAAWGRAQSLADSIDTSVAEGAERDIGRLPPRGDLTIPDPHPLDALSLIAQGLLNEGSDQLYAGLNRASDEVLDALTPFETSTGGNRGFDAKPQPRSRRRRAPP